MGVSPQKPIYQAVFSGASFWGSLALWQHFGGKSLGLYHGKNIGASLYCMAGLGTSAVLAAGVGGTPIGSSLGDSVTKIRRLVISLKNGDESLFIFQRLAVAAMTICIFFFAGGHLAYFLPSHLNNPGSFGRTSFPGDSSSIKQKYRSELHETFKKEGCHTCGWRPFRFQRVAKGNQSVRCIGDHQPPRSLAKKGTEFRMFAHCSECSNKQGGKLASRRKPSQASLLVYHARRLRISKLSPLFAPFAVAFITDVI